MNGKRVAPSQEGQAPGRGRIWLIVLASAAGVLLLAAAGLGIYANTYGGIFPGVSVSGVELAGKSREEAAEILARELPAQLEQRTVSVSADGYDLGTWTLKELGAYVQPEEQAAAAWSVGREEGPAGWFANGWTMARRLLGLGSGEVSAAVHYEQTALDAAVADMAGRFDRAPMDGSYELTREGLFATRAQDGQALDRAGLARMLAENTGEAVEAPWSSVPARELDLEAMAAGLSAEASPARYDIESGQVVDGHVGVSLDPDAAAFALDAAQAGETVKLPVEIVFPEMTAQELEAVLFRDLLSTTTTDVSGTAARKGNVKLAGDQVNGTILNDGDIFDYNLVVGERTVERGFGEAATYVNGETVNTVGGGICQVSSTVYLASLLANLEIVERYAHRYYPGYITLGMDATVSWGGPEFRFKNNTGYPIRIDVSYANSQLTVSIYGTKTDDTYVKMTRDVLSTTSYETEYVETEDLPYGTQKQKQNGYVGYEVKSYRNIYSGDGKLLSSTLEAKSSYKSRNQIILVGIAGKPADTPQPPDGGEGGGGEPTLPPEDVPAGGDVPGEDLTLPPEDETPPAWLFP